MKYKYALVNGQRQEAQPGLSGKCQSYGHPMVAKCGEKRIWHWAHRGGHTCDPWWEESEWHRAWKEQFPPDWQEVVLTAESGEKHIADVKTDQGWVLEFQHSYLNPEERRAREAFYRKLVWVVDGTRLKRGRSQFFKALKEGTRVNAKPLMLRVSSDACALLREWAGSPAPVFFDFGGVNKPEDGMLWCLLPGNPDRGAYVVAFSRAYFVELHCAGATQMGQDFAEVLKILSEVVSVYISRRRAQALKQRAQALKQLARQPQYRRSRRRARPRTPRF